MNISEKGAEGFDFEILLKSAFSRQENFSMVQPQTCGGQVQDLCFQSAELKKQSLGLESQRPG